MKFIKPKYEIIEQAPGLVGMYKHIERMTRVCYKSEENITETSYEKFVNMIKNNNHGAMLEHGTVYLKIPINVDIVGTYIDNKYTIAKLQIQDSPHWWAVTTNYRVIIENGWEDDLKYWCEPTEHHEKRRSVLFVSDLLIQRELVRHRVFSYAGESTRFCNYSKGKFDSEISYVYPCWLDSTLIDSLKCESEKHLYEIISDSHNDNALRATASFVLDLKNAESSYMFKIEMGWTAQQARVVLAVDTKCDTVVTGEESYWKGWFDLRADKAAHPSMRELAYPLKDEFIERGYIKDI